MKRFFRRMSQARHSLSDELTNLDFCLSKEHYFETLAKLLARQFNSDICSVWDNNFFEKVLVHLGESLKIPVGIPAIP